MRVVVTGASGFLGSRVLWQLRAQGHKPIALIRDGADRSRFSSFDPDVVIGDVTDRQSLEAAFTHADMVVHAAAAYALGPADPAHLDAVNVDGSSHVFSAAADAHIPVVHVSSTNALGPTGPEPMAETYWSHAEPPTHYGRTKRSAHALARTFQDKGADVRIGIPGRIYGPGDASLFGRLTRLGMRLPPPVLAFGNTVQSTVHVDDCADGIVRIIETGTPGNDYLLCAEHQTIAEWLATLMAAVDKPTPLLHLPDAVAVQAARVVEWGIHAFGGPHEKVREYAAALSRSHAYSGSKARRELGWNPRPLAVGLQQLVADRQRVGRGRLLPAVPSASAGR